MSRRAASRILLAGAVIVLACAFAIDRTYGVDVTFLHRLRTPEEQDEWRRLRDPDDDIAEIYGYVEPPRDRTRVLLFDAADPRVIRPREDPSRTLLYLDRAVGDAATFADQVWPPAIGLAALLAAAALWVWARSRARGRAPDAGA